MNIKDGKRLVAIKRLIEAYFPLEKGIFIDRYSELLRVFDVRPLPEKKHPHRHSRVYISRRALKHFVESRKRDLLINHSKEATLEAIYFAINKLSETINDFDSYSNKPPNHIFAKNYSHIGKPFLRVIIEADESILEIKSIHFRKNDK